jgi:hypothetical protein
MNLIPDDLRAKLLANGRQSVDNDRFDPPPVVKLFTPDGGATWLLTEIDPDDQDRAFGLCDLGMGFPELGYVSLAELTAVRGPLGLAIERDLHFLGDKPASMRARLGWPEKSWLNRQGAGGAALGLMTWRHSLTPALCPIHRASARITYRSPCSPRHRPVSATSGDGLP